MAEQTSDPGKALAAYDPRQYQVVVKPEDLVPLSPLVRIDLTAVPLGECAAIGGGKVMPSREVTDQIGSAAGVTFIESGCSVEKLDSTTWVGRATAERMMRDGSRERRVAEYEWDAELKAQKVADKPIVEWRNRQKTERARTDEDRRNDLLNMKEYGRQRADTGARLRVIRSLTGIPTAFTQAQAARPLVLARSSLNVEVAMADPVMRQALIAQAIGAGGDVFGAGPMRDVTPEPEALPDAPETPLDAETAEAVADTVVEEEVARGVFPDDRGAESFTEAEQAGIEDVFGDASGAADVEVERAWLKKELDKGLGEKGTEAVTAGIADPHLTAARGRALREELAKGLGPKGTEQVTAAVNDPKLTVELARKLRESVASYRKQQAQTQTQTQGGQS